ncbi:hypothetical protein N7490_012219 [Penicillium lividum]|nr:hypothetical protein N7490_012219 [Penicillium lividum]
MATSPAGRMLARQLQQMQSDKDIPGISCGLVDSNIFEWEVMLMISDDVKFLHLYPAPPEEDKYGYESAAERWSPVQTPETILLSVISMLSSPNDESPANVEAARLWREDPAEFKKRVRRCVRDSLEE